MKHLSVKVIHQIASKYGYALRDKIVVESAHQADENHGKPAGIVSWSTDSRGHYDAEKLLDGYLRETARCERADAAKADAFHRNAYGC